AVPESDPEDEGGPDDLPAAAGASSGLLGTGTGEAVSTAHTERHESPSTDFATNLRRARRLFVPYMGPLLLVYIGEHTINQGVAPTLLFPLDSSPFGEYRAFYPFYGFLYQLGVFISRSSIPFVRIRNLYLPSFLQVANLFVLTLQALFDYIPSVYLVF